MRKLFLLAVVVMPIFVTGASGYIGSALTRLLVEAGHQVVGLARSHASADRLKVWGAEAREGELKDVDSLAAGARDTTASSISPSDMTATSRPLPKRT